MPRRVNLPGSAELFRASGPAEADDFDDPTAIPAEQDALRTTPRVAPAPVKAPATGRVRHDEKITVYFSSDELIRLEDARLDLRRHHRLAVDRGRIVRAAVALALADLAEQGPSSALYRQLQQ